MFHASCCRTCDLQARAPLYSGTCEPAMPFQANSNSSTTPYACQSLDSNTPLTGDACTSQIDKQLDCSAVCICADVAPDQLSVSTTCAASDSTPTYCQCEACQKILPVEQEEGYQTVLDVATQVDSSGGARRLVEAGNDSVAGRKLQQVRKMAALPALKPRFAVLRHHRSSKASERCMPALRGCRSNSIADAALLLPSPTASQQVNCNQMHWRHLDYPL